MQISSLIRYDKEYSAFVDCLKGTYKRAQPLPIAVNGLAAGLDQCFLIESVKEARAITDAPALILVSGDAERITVREALECSGLRAFEYKGREFVFNNITASHDIERERLKVLYSIASGGCDVIITTPDAALQFTMPMDVLLGHSLSISLGDEIPPSVLTAKLLSMGFSLADTVEGVGQLAERGGIVDFWGDDMQSPIRVEFFGDEVDRIMSFDPITQRSIDAADDVLILPAREVLMEKAAFEKVGAVVASLLRSGKISDEMREKLLNEKNSLEAELSCDFRDKYLGAIYDNETCLFDYIFENSRPIIFILGTNNCHENAEKYTKRLSDAKEGMISLGAVSRDVARYHRSIDEYTEYLSLGLSVHINQFSGGVSGLKLSGLFGFRSRRTVAYGGAGNATMLYEDIAGFKKGGYRIILLSETRAGADALVSALREADIYALNISDKSDFDVESLEVGMIAVDIGSDRGFDLMAPRIAVLSMVRDRGREIMAQRKRQRMLRRVGGAGKRIMSYAELSPGDYVVHANYGIGLFEGMESVTIDGVTRDYITIKYAGTDKLYLPADRLEMIGRYIGERDKNGEVKLSVMGGRDWAKSKSRAKAAVKDIAKNLIALYAERQRTPGFAFAADSEVEDEFDADFSYVETESQLQAIEEIKRDMMRPVPMNRLLCGDVGFGKTEVALRAAFKAIMNGKQVALLVPTTILALQHYETALSRMRSYGVRVEMLSRFKKPKERARIIDDTRRGAVDLLIGTHALLSKNTEFRDLGLLIIDEEQRFGVVQKEKLRQMARNVDTLMLSATPIPRTLNMSMSGINDISVLDEAPGERRPVETYVLEYDEGVILGALRRELDRGGQVLYLYNNIDTIELCADKLTEALPDARIAYAHGRMERDEIEDVWQSLVEGEIDILVCTTIIETGVDLPNANTLIIENADRFGLSQLHQIRGRVGRSSRQAYAYFTYRRGKALSEIAEKRLEAIKEFAEFGAGFKVALRDLEIRGAGNLLGAEQHGYIESVGYDLYIKLLNEAVIEERGETPTKKFESQIAIAVSAHIPEYYVKSSAARMEMYKKISLISTKDDKDDLYDELTDRFGDVPRPVERLLNVALTKAIAERMHIKKISLEGTRLSFVAEGLRLDLWSEVFAKFKSISFAGVGSQLVVMRLLRGEDPTDMALKVMLEYERSANEK